MNLFLTLLFLNLNYSEPDWTIYFENEKIEISYSISVCEDKKYQIKHEYFLIKVKNKTQETKVINFHKGIKNINNDEDKIAFVLKPNEFRVGNCDNTFDLNIFSRDMINSKKETTSKFYLSNIKVIEVY